MNPLLLCTDLDRTLLPNGAQPESPRARPLFAALVAQPAVRLAYVSGRDAALIREAIATWHLPIPDFVLADVGTTIYTVHNHSWRQLLAWEQHIAADWHGHTASGLLPLVEACPAAAGLQLQGAERQRPYKLSFYAAATFNCAHALPLLREAFAQRSIRANLIWSIDETTATGLLDILPASAGKLSALRFLARQLDLAEETLLFAGDSGNDLEVLQSSVPGVLVANATPVVRAQLDPGTPGLWLAQGGYLGMNGYYAGGILEGLAHFRPDVDRFLRGCHEDGE